ncbi:expressed unknown protein [Seminavis robusta]|uniref:PDZ domain-containing protein n=1 Tax=Seminavis robusta TaxID=568900 RepID=A0A9N8HHV8_9STRA|nr:expressed unknown protein [Seminavis robusta]|eukprot:Sro466_g148880.1 n/a (209) ;mRNA; r:55800-56568
MRTTRAITSVTLLGVASGFTSQPAFSRQSTELQMGLFDGVKDAFSAPALERSTLDSERETPIDRWMGWSVARQDEAATEEAAAAVPSDFVDSMDESNYVAVELTKPMGIVFEENDDDFGGIFVQSIKEGGAADTNGVLMEGDQLVSVGTKPVHGMPFDDALGTIVDATGETVKLVLFRGAAKQFYGPTGASKEWLAGFVEKGGVDVLA